MTTDADTVPADTAPRSIARNLLAAALIFAGLSHLFWARKDFQAQVPDWVPMDKDGVVMASGGVEIMLGGGLAIARRDRVRVGRIAALFFAAVFPGNIAQWQGQRDAFGLDTDRKRFVRLLFQPLLILWALWSTGTPKVRR
ncbi:hypothetical protein DW322_20770 [Rhodococcus rhodnii]|uniref:DoxX family membrane protein n=2 Tax=Rhodococcus rhodnii TaxID=38312 RepID=R7WMN2_9NOCA|nr:hypothetical protein [Rhodococcus rhodnii]EOM76545.1 hypothetical protein Rrhod_2085 [Rhodococcus rhodnii LMG 5362]TXG92159.1 hypothetical protein DW322_20770 [Rhodococcus rhodnii]